MSDFLNNKVIPAVTKFAQFKFVRAMHVRLDHLLSMENLSDETS